VCVCVGIVHLSIHRSPGPHVCECVCVYVSVCGD